MDQTQQKVVIMGGAGFIGSHTTRALRARGASVVVFDSLVSGSRENVPDDVEFVEGDIRDREAVAKVLEGATHVVHLAALVSVPESMKDPLLTHDVNVTGFVNVLDIARSANVQRVVYASSAAVYGDDPILPKHEGLPVAPLSPYALSKVMNELSAREYFALYGLPSIGLRFFNVYGPGQKGNHPYASVVPRFIEAIKGNTPIQVFGDGTQTRDFVHVSDIANAICSALFASKEVGGVFNVATGVEVSLRELLSLMETHLGRPVEWAAHPVRPGDLARSVADIGEIQKVLVFTPQISLTDGIQELLSS